MTVRKALTMLFDKSKKNQKKSVKGVDTKKPIRYNKRTRHNECLPDSGKSGIAAYGTTINIERAMAIVTLHRFIKNFRNHYYIWRGEPTREG